MKFKYNGRIYNPVNVEKKLKKMGITMEDIEILPDEKKKKETSDELEDWMKDKEMVNLVTDSDDIKRVVIVPKGERPDIVELLKNQIWNPITKTGLYSIEFLKTLRYE